MYGEYRPDYVIKDAGNNGIFKIIRFKLGDSDYVKIEKDECKSNSEKLDNNICRARSTVLELAMCNEWEWFVTLTLDASKYNRFDLGKFQRDLSQWFRDKRKLYDSKLQFLLIPEAHKDGAWHMHGLLNGVPYDEIDDFKAGIHPAKLVRAGYRNFPAYAAKFGFISMGRIKDKAKCAFYISKYITKDLSRRIGDLNSHLYYASKGLNRFENVAYLNGSFPELNEKLVVKGEFCETGFVFGESELFGTRFDHFPENVSQVVQTVDDEAAFLFIADVITDDDLISFYDKQ